MNKISKQQQAATNMALPDSQNARMGSRLKEKDEFGLLQISVYQPAGTTGVITTLQPGQALVAGALGVGPDGNYDPDIAFDFEVVDIIVRTESAVASSTIQAKKGTTAISDAIISAVANAITRAGSIDPAQAKFTPRSNYAGYLASPLNLVDAGGATAAARTVTLILRKIT